MNLIWKKSTIITEIFVSLYLYFLMAFQHRTGELPHSHRLQQTQRECLVSREELQPRPEIHNFIRNKSFLTKAKQEHSPQYILHPMKKAQVSNITTKSYFYTIWKYYLVWFRIWCQATLEADASKSAVFADYIFYNTTKSTVSGAWILALPLTSCGTSASCIAWFPHL